MTLKSAAASRCSSGERCVSYPALGEPARLSRGNPGPRCFACQERSAVSRLEVASTEVEIVERRSANGLPLGRSEGLDGRASLGRGEDEQHFREVVERRRSSILTCERGLRSALASGDERLVHRWSRSLREARERLVWAEADLQAALPQARADGSAVARGRAPPHAPPTRAS